MRMETAFVILHAMATRTDHRILRIQIGPNKRNAMGINTKMKTAPHPISTRKGSAIVKKTHGTGNPQGKIVKTSETEFVTTPGQKEEDPRKETVKNKEKRGSAPFSLPG